MKKTILLICSIFIFILIGCTQKISPQPNSNLSNSNNTNTLPSSPIVSKDTTLRNYNEAGKIMIVMYHQFVSKETNDWTRSFDNFAKDLEVLYKKGYRLINLKDYINGNINVPAGYTPIIFTFDDGTSGQFNLVEENGSLKANTKSAVGIMEEFNKVHNDFPLKGTFFINHTGFFGGKGTPKEKLNYLINKGFEIGNHTVNHVNLKKVKSAQHIQKEIGGNVKLTQEYLQGYDVNEFALPLGITSKLFPDYVIKGEYQGIKYENKAIMLVGSNPALSPISKKADFLNLPRVRAVGNKPVVNDLDHWLSYFDKNPNEKFVSDGNPNTFTINSSVQSLIDAHKYKDKQIILVQ